MEMVQVDLGATSPLVYVSPIHDLASRNPDDDAAPPPSPPPPPPSPPPPFRLYLSKVENARFSKRRQEWKPERAFHRAEKLKACCVNNEAESTSAGPFSVFAHRNIVLSLSWRVYRMSRLYRIDPDLMTDFLTNLKSSFFAREKITKAYYLAHFFNFIFKVRVYFCDHITLE